MSKIESGSSRPADSEAHALNDELNAELPTDVASAFQTSLAADSMPRTLAEWIGLLDGLVEDWPPAVAELCHADDGNHLAVVDTQSFRFACVLDAMLLPFLRGEDTTITSRVPAGDEITFQVTRTDVIGPTDAVISFGAAGRAPAGDLTPAHAYGTICPFIHTFPDEDAYAGWAAGVDGATMSLSLPTALGLAKAMVRA